MVQRKAPSKLTVQSHHLKTETLFHQHDLKSNKGSPDLKKKMMKKSGSTKRPKTPNYMRPTTSSDARKEQSQSPSPVSTRNSSILRRKSSDNLKNGVSSGKKTTRTLLARSLTKNPSFKPSRRSSTVVLCENLDAQRATCSSTLKDCKFPAYLSLNQGGTESEGTSAVKVCPYTYCSLNGHHHAPLPPLKCFLSARRRTIKTQRSVKLGCLSPRRARPVGDVEEGDKDFFVEIYSKKDEDAGDIGEDQEEGVIVTLSDAPIYDDYEARDETPLLVEEERNVELLNELPADVRSDQLDDSDVDWETGYQSSLHLDYDYGYTPATDMEPDPEAGGDGGENHIIDDEFIVYSDGKDCGFDEVSQESYEESINSDAFSSSDDDGESTGSCEEHLESAGDDDDEHILSETSFDNPSHEYVPNEGAIEEQVSKLESFDEDIITSSTGKEPHSEGVPLNSSEGNDLGPETEETALARVTAKAKKSVQESDDLGCFNPRGPNFLPLEEESDGEKVDLRHQDLDERKNSEEWMVDYALRQVVTKLGPARKKKVALLVEAFEKVMPTRKYDLQLMHSSAFDQSRTLQACI